MKVDAYQTDIKDPNDPDTKVSISIPSGSSISTALGDLGHPNANTSLSKTLDLDPHDKRIGYDAAEAIREINKKGYYVSGHKTLFEINPA